MINSLLFKAEHKHVLNQRTTFKKEKEDKRQWLSVTFTNEKSSRKLKNILESKTDNRITFSTKNKLKFKLNNPKDKISPEEKSGIYNIQCKDCSKQYIGQTRRTVKTRYKEHIGHLRKGNIEKSAVAKHCIEENHAVKEVTLIKSVNNKTKLNAWETHFINKEKDEHLINIENPPILNSVLLKL